MRNIGSKCKMGIRFLQNQNIILNEWFCYEDVA
jgi:hypothetical protein